DWTAALRRGTGLAAGARHRGRAQADRGHPRRRARARHSGSAGALRVLRAADAAFGAAVVSVARPAPRNGVGLRDIGAVAGRDGARPPRRELRVRAFEPGARLRRVRYPVAARAGELGVVRDREISDAEPLRQLWRRALRAREHVAPALHDLTPLAARDRVV